MSALLARDVAAEFYRVNSARDFSSAHELVDAINAYMASKGLSGSKIDRLDIAGHVLELQRQKIATPEQAAWQNDQAQGIGDRLPDEIAFRRMDELANAGRAQALAGQVQAMDQAQYAAFRREIGLDKDLVTFLSGN